MIKKLWSHHHSRPSPKAGDSCKVLVQPKLKQQGRIPGKPPPRPHWPTEHQCIPGHLSHHLPTAWGHHGIWCLLPPQGPLLLQAPISEVPFGQKNPGPHPRNPLSFQNSWPWPSRLLLFQEQTFHSRVSDAEDPRKLVLSRSSLWDSLTTSDQIYLLSKRENMTLVFKQIDDRYDLKADRQIHR